MPRCRVDGLGVLRTQDVVRDRVMDDLAALDVGRTDFDHPHPSRLGHRDVAHRPPPLSWSDGRHRVFGRLDDQVRRSEAVVLRLPVQLSVATGFSGGMSAGSPSSAPWSTQRDDGVDLLVGERHVVLEFLNADAAVDVPRRHLPRRTRRDGARPRTCFLVGHERHRRDRTRLVARLALGLEDRRDVLRERHLLGRGQQYVTNQ